MTDEETIMRTTESCKKVRWSLKPQQELRIAMDGSNKV